MDQAESKINAKSRSKNRKDKEPIEKKLIENETVASNDNTSQNEPVSELQTTTTDSTNVKKGSFLTFKRILIIYAILYFGRTVYKTIYKTKDPNKQYYKNDLQLNDGFNITIYLKDKYRRQQRVVSETTGLLYNYDSSSQLRFNLTLTEEEFKNREYLSLMPVVSYNNKLFGKTENIVCETGVVEELEERKSDKEGSMQGVVEKHNKGEKSSHLRTKLFFHLVIDENERAVNDDPILNFMYFKNQDKKETYKPYIDCSQYWVLRRDKKPVRFLSDSTPTIQITFDTYWWYRFTWMMNFYIGEQQTTSLLHDSSAFDEIKNILSDNSYSYLTILFTVNILHSLFSFLSVKNKLSFWKKVDSSEGISKRQYYLDVLFQMVIVLYLLDNEASFILIIFTAIETLISFWIAIRLLKFEPRPDGKFPYYRLKQEALNTNEEKTAEYDRTATNFMSMILMPILIVYTIYSFYYRGEMAMYSFILKTLVSFIYAIGFINMTPQIYINYKFKSVDRMPWKAMIYQFLNTIVDDLFAFAVKMPTLQRISVFRDDIVFVIYLYQYWIYRNNSMKSSVKKEE